MFNPHRKVSSTGQVILGFGAFSSVITLWTIITGLGLVSQAMLPSPMSVINAFYQLGIESGTLWIASAVSLGRILLALVLVMAIGIPFGIVLGASPVLNRFFSPLIDPFRSAPVVALLPLFVMWFGIDEAMKIAFLFTCAVVYLVPMVRDAVIAVPFTYWESAKDLGATDVECITKSVLPIALPRIFDAVATSMSIGWTYITVAEYVNATSGLGQLIQNARRFSAMDQVFVGILTIILLALVSYSAFNLLRKKLFKWEIA